MPLILAIEPNKNQAHQLALVVKQLKGELVAAVSADAALTALGDRVPDLILTPALLPPRDEAALTDRLRQLGAAAAHVQTLAVPILAADRKGSRDSGGGSGLLGRRRDKSDANDTVGCDPAVFAEQIKVYLDRAAREREASAEAVEAAAPPAAAASPDTEASIATSQDTEVSLDEFDELEWLPETPPVPSVAPAPDGAPPEEPVIEPPPPLVERRKARTDSPATRAWEAELGLPRGVAGSPPLWRVTEEGIEALTPESIVVVDDSSEIVPEAASPVVAASPDVVAPPIVTPSGVVAAPVVASSVVMAPPPKPPKAPKVRKQPPVLDDWAYFDPQQSPFKALIRRLDEIAGHAHP